MSLTDVKWGNNWTRLKIMKTCISEWLTTNLETFQSKSEWNGFTETEAITSSILGT